MYLYNVQSVHINNNGILRGMAEKRPGTNWKLNAPKKQEKAENCK
jgi:hypothetical protein